MKRITNVEDLSRPAGPYAFAVTEGGIVYTAGQIGQMADGALIEGGFIAEARQVMTNLQRILQAAAIDFRDVTKTTVYLTDATDFARLNEVYAAYFPDGRYPVRETVVVAALPLGARVEISVIAHSRSSD